ncbi:MAG: response regulator transcription factor, partial [Verrucomicrobiales bacterium]
LIVLDLMLPGKDGIQVFKEVRKDPRTRTTPVIMLTAKAQTADRIKGLEEGADDYVTKPFSPKELVLRVKAVLKRSHMVNAGESGRLTSGDFMLDKENLKLFLAGEQVDLTVTEFKLLALLMERTGHPQDRDDLLREVWGYSDQIYTRTLDTHVKRLREKLGRHADAIRTVRGVGYEFRAEGSGSGGDGDADADVDAEASAES